LDDAKASLSGIGILQAQKLTAKDVTTIEELVYFLGKLKESVSVGKSK
jgi:predicted RecB family nuclease